MGTNILGLVEDASSDAMGFDTNVVVTPEAARAFVGDGYRFCVRYVSHNTAEGTHDISRAEAEGILAAGLALMIVQHVRRQGWVPTVAMGSSDGALVARHALDIGCPSGLSLWCDIEGFAPEVKAADILAYGNAWHAAVTAAGFVPGIYVGTFKLSSSQLYHGLAFKLYWKSGMKVADVEKRGYQMIQHAPGDLAAHGITIDRDTIHSDHLGGVPRWLVQGPKPEAS